MPLPEPRIRLRLFPSLVFLPSARLEDKTARPGERADFFGLAHQRERTTVAGRRIGGAAAFAHDFGSKLHARKLPLIAPDVNALLRCAPRIEFSANA